MPFICLALTVIPKCANFSWTTRRISGLKATCTPLIHARYNCTPCSSFISIFVIPCEQGCNPSSRLLLPRSYRRVQVARAEEGRRGGEEDVRPPLAAARAVAVSKLTRCVAGMETLPSNAPSTRTRARLWRICAASGRRSDAAARAAPHAHPSQT